MILRRLCRLLSLPALLLVATALPAQTPPDVSLKVVKYPELARIVRQHAGKVVVVDFWSNTCIPCKKKFPHLVEMSQKYAKQGLVVISVSTDPDAQTKETQETALAFLKPMKATFTNLLLDEPEAFWADKLGVDSLPTVFVFNRAGRWRKFTGEQANSEDIEALVAEWLNKTN